MADAFNENSNEENNAFAVVVVEGYKGYEDNDGDDDAEVDGYDGDAAVAAAGDDDDDNNDEDSDEDDNDDDGDDNGDDDDDDDDGGVNFEDVS